MGLITTYVQTNNVPPSPDSDTNSLLRGIKWGESKETTSLTYSFPQTDSARFVGILGVFEYSSRSEPKYGYTELTPIQQDAVEKVFQEWSHVANITFTEVQENDLDFGIIRIAWTNLLVTVISPITGKEARAWGWSSFPNSYQPSGGDVWISNVNPKSPFGENTSWEKGSYNYIALTHEIGHSLGLKHPFDGKSILPEDKDFQTHTVMSYTNVPHSLFVEKVIHADGSFSWDSSQILPETPMPYDIKAIQYMYGPNLSYHTGDDIYTFDPNIPFFKTIWDAGGTDTISVSTFSKDCIIDLQQGQFSKITIESDDISADILKVIGHGEIPANIYDGTNNLAIAFETIIENAIGGAGNDILIGNEVNNVFDGGIGNDTIHGGEGSDTFIMHGTVFDYAILSEAYDTKIEKYEDDGPLSESDMLFDIEYLRFGNSAYTTDIPIFDAVTNHPSHVAEQIAGLYVDSFHRGPDAEGFDYWFHELYTGAETISQIASDFVRSAEYQLLHPGFPEV